MDRLHPTKRDEKICQEILSNKNPIGMDEQMPKKKKKHHPIGMDEQICPKKRETSSNWDGNGYDKKYYIRTIQSGWMDTTKYYIKNIGRI
jgi:hypothetical protein